MAEHPVPEHESSVHDEIVSVRVRRAPKYGVFLIAGAVLGILVALVLTVAGDGFDVSPYTQVSYSQTQVFGFMALVCGAVGLAVGGVVALLFDRSMGRRQRSVSVDHERHRG